MKKLYTLFLFCSFSIISFSQTTLIPDANFEQKLIDLGIDTNGLTGTILNSDAQSVTSLNVTSASISNLEGIKAFTALTDLNCSNNSLVFLDVVEISGLLTLSCQDNILTQLVFNSGLTQLICKNNNLTSLDLSLNASLNHLECQNNSLYSLNLMNGNNGSLGTMIATSNNLTCVNVDDAGNASSGTGIYFGLMWSIDASSFYSEFCFTYIPDDNFEQALIDLGYDTVLDDFVITSNINGISVLDISNKNIDDVTGLERFNALISFNCDNNNIQLLDLSHNANLITLNASYNQIENLHLPNSTSLNYLFCSDNALSNLDITQNTDLINLTCINNQLTNLDVTQNIALASLYCSDNSLSGLDVTQNTLLSVLVCNQNLLTSMDVTQNTLLSTFQCASNSLTSLDVTQNTLLYYLYCADNLLDNIDVSQNTDLNILDCNTNNLTSLNVTLNVSLITLRVYTNSFDFLDLKQNSLLTIFVATDIPALSCVQVANEADANAGSGIYTGWINTTGASYSEFCSEFYTYVPDNNFEQALINLGYDSTLDDYVLTSNIELITPLDVSGKSISDLTGIEDFIALQNLQCANNSLATLDLTQNINLIDLRCFQNSLTSLDVTQNSLLTDLRCGTNSISSLDVSQNTALTSLRVQNNLLSTLDITSNTALETLYIYNNSMTEINVDHLTNLSSLWCYNNDLNALDLVQNTLLTDINATLNTNLACIQVLDETAANSNTGIYATWLKDITTTYAEFCFDFHTYVPDNNFEQALIDLGYDTTLDDYVLTTNIASITSLDVNSKSISDLTGIEDFVTLTTLDCYNNQLTSLDVTQNTDLIYLFCVGNQLTTLDVSSNTGLATLYCYTNQLTSLDVSKNVVLTNLQCHTNQLTSLDLSQNIALTTVSCYNNQLTNLNVKNGNNTVISIFNADNNPDLTCIEVDDTAYSIANWINIDAQTNFSEDCATLNVNEVAELDENIKLYPNPSNDVIYLQLSGNKEINNVEIYNLLGKKVTINFNSNLSFDVSQLTSGLYFVQISVENHVITKKLMIKN